MKIIRLLVLFALCFAKLNAQSWQDNIKDPANFYSIRQAYLDYNNSDKKEAKIMSLEADGEEQKFRRWEYIMEPRVYPSGKTPASGYLLDELNKFNSLNRVIIDSSLQGNWTPLESSEGFPQNGYLGRLNCIAFHPQDSNIMFVGSPSGGLWKTTNGGKYWYPMTDFLPSLGVSEIVINLQNPDIIYIATGDKDAANFISNPYSYGLLKSTNGGQTWETTGLKHLFEDQMTIQRLIIHPTQPNILMAAITGINGALRGIWRTTDGGDNWTNVSGGGKFDVEFNPGDPNIVYGSGYKYLVRSTNAGKDWAVINSAVLPSADISSARIAVTPANPHIVYVQYLNPSTGMTYGLYKSEDDGATWVKKNLAAINTQAGYDWVLTVSPTDTNLVFYGGQDLFCTTDGGKNLISLPHGHVDHHGLDYRPGSNTLYNCNDGGIYKSYNNSKSWENLNRSLQTFQYYRLGSSATNSSLILTGAQDNGTQKHDNPFWAQVGILADGTECIVDYSDETIYYLAYQYGYMYRYGNVTGAFTPPPTSMNSNSCAWVSPYLIHPANPKILFFGAKDIYKSTNRGNEWSNYSSQLTMQDNVGGGMLRSMAISGSNPDSVLYAASYVVVYKTSDAGRSWQNVTSNLPTTAGCFDCSAISCVAVHPGNPQIAWVTMSGYSSKNKVFKTSDGGTTWFNITDNLPNMPVNCIVFEKNNKDALYIGTDLGAFFRDSTMSNWVPYMKGLPNVPVSELEIHYPTKTLRAATFGRGLWESSLYGVITSAEDLQLKTADRTLYPNPAKNYIELPEAFLNNKNHVSVFSSIGIKVFQGEPMKRLDISFLPTGIYFLKTGNKMYKFVKI